jgi:hypothetical protein
VKFYQQEKVAKSIFDGNIFQDEFKIAIETKLFDNYSLSQMKNHIDSLSSENGKNRVLLALSKSELSRHIKAQIVEYIKVTNSDIKLASISFSGLIDLVLQNIAEYEIEFIEEIEEYREFCLENRLMMDKNDYMLVVTAGTSLKENLEYGIHYDPVERNHNTSFKYMGLYVNKAIVAIGEVKYCVWADLVNDSIVINNEINVPDDVKDRISGIIKNTNYYDIRKGHKFYIVDKFYPTNVIKTSSGSLRAKQYFNISDFPGVTAVSNAEELASSLAGKEWQ